MAESGISIQSRFAMAKGGSSIPWQSGLECKKEKKAMKKRNKTLKQNTLFSKDLIDEYGHSTMKTNSDSSWWVSDLEETSSQVSEVPSPTMDVSSTLSQWIDDSDDNVPRVDLTEESSRFIDKAAWVIQGYNANEGKKYQVHKILTVISTHEIPLRYYFLTFEVRNPEAAAAADGRAAFEICWAKIADYGAGESYVECCRIY